MQRIDPSVAMGGVKSMDRVLVESVDPPRLVMLLMTVFAVLALTLAAVGGARLAQNLLRPHRPHCLTVRCPCPFGADLARPATPRVVAIWSAQDGIVRPSACRPEGAESREVTGSHIGLGVNAQVYRHLADVLARD